MAVSNRSLSVPFLLLSLLLVAGQTQSAQAGSLRAGSLEASPAADCAAAQRSVDEQAARLRAATPRLETLLLGEIHTSVADHAWQLEVLKAVQQQRPRMILGLEMIPAARQAVLDRFSAGRITEEEFLRQVGWADVWGHDPALYLPLLRWARQRGVPLLALNAEPELVKRVRRGGLASIPRSEREGIGTPLSAGPGYRRRLEAVWRGHRIFAPLAPGSAQAQADAADLQRFIDSQLLRDRAMAEHLAASRRRDPERLVVALIGRGHLEAGDGVPRQLEALGIRRSAALLRPELPEICAPAPRGARLGAYLESEGGAVWVRRVAPGSAAERGGLRPGDRIRTLNGAAVERAGQVILRVSQHPPGEPLRLGIERQGRQRQLDLTLPPPSGRPANGDNGGTSAPAAGAP